jgi:hypothetical protein
VQHCQEGVLTLFPADEDAAESIHPAVRRLTPHHRLTSGRSCPAPQPRRLAVSAAWRFNLSELGALGDLAVQSSGHIRPALDPSQAPWRSPRLGG